MFSSLGTPTRTVTTLPQGVRLTPTGVKNGIAIPANVVTSSSGGAQLMYVVQPTSSLVTTTAQGGQKTVLLNFQPGNGILSKYLVLQIQKLLSIYHNMIILSPTYKPLSKSANLCSIGFVINIYVAIINILKHLQFAEIDENLILERLSILLPFFLCSY